ncbi:transcriptional repressor NrdR [Candidatus Gracilibacteria bacterium]|nr:transcriptional repressor NrdR [Candidatus Gracilibacteria bacterium]
MNCSNCGNTDTKVLDSRVSDDGKTVKRRRECEKCQNRFTTFEKGAVSNLIIVKSGDVKERYDRDKLEDSILKATNKRGISILDVERAIDEIESELGTGKEIKARRVGEKVLEKLKILDDISYIRYASVYHNFTSAKDFLDFIQD